MSISKEQLLAACTNGDTSRLRELLEAPTTTDNTTSRPKDLTHLGPTTAEEMLGKACQFNNIDTVQLILLSYPKTVITEEAIRHTITTKSIPLYKTLRQYDPNIVRTTIHDGRESQLGRALSIASTPEYIEFLLSSGVNPNPHIDSDAVSPLCLVSLPGQSDATELFKILFRHGAKLRGSGALAAAAKHGQKDLVEFLLQQGANVNDVDLVSLNPQRWSPLHAAVEAGQSDIVSIFLDHGAYHNMLQNGRTALAVAEAKGDAKIIELLQPYTMNG